MTRGALAIVDGWHAALNAGSADRVRALCDNQVEVLGPRGSGVIASSDLVDWMFRSGFSATPERWFCGADGAVVVEQSAQWKDARLTVATHFKVEQQSIVSIRRHADLTGALEDAGLSTSDEVTGRGCAG
jgi:hypothetical protein